MKENNLVIAFDMSSYTEEELNNLMEEAFEFTSSDEYLQQLSNIYKEAGLNINLELLQKIMTIYKKAFGKGWQLNFVKAYLNTERSIMTTKILEDKIIKNKIIQLKNEKFKNLINEYLIGNSLKKPMYFSNQTKFSFINEIQDKTIYHQDKIEQPDWSVLFSPMTKSLIEGDFFVGFTFLGGIFGGIGYYVQELQNMGSVGVEDRGDSEMREKVKQVRINSFCERGKPFYDKNHDFPFQKIKLSDEEIDKYFEIVKNILV